MSQLPTPPPPRDLDLLGKVARLHYEYGLTHQEVADVLHLSRVKVTRLLRRARDLGIVQIRILSDASPFAVLEMDLSLHFGLDEALIVPTTEDEGEQRRLLAHGAARYLQRVIADDLVVAIGLSRTVAMIPQFVVDPRPTRVSFVSMSGGLRKVSLAANPYEGTERLAHLFGGSAEHLHAPAIVGSAKVARALLGDPATGDVLRHAASADVALLGVGGISGHATLVDEEELSPSEVEALIDTGAVGDVAGRFFDARGAPVKHELNSRVIGLTLEQIRQIPLRIVVAGGVGKTTAIAAALRGQLPTVLVVDVATANLVLSATDGREAGVASPRPATTTETA
jgi:DNA-binding transcriptional regulator LsrR (DeoR family)